MSGFKKSGIYPLNPGAVSDRQIVINPNNSSLSCSKSDSSLAQDSSTGHEDSLPFTREEYSRYQTRYEEGCNIQDPYYLVWLRIHQPESACSAVGSNSSASVVVSDMSSSSSLVSLPTMNSPASATHSPALSNSNPACSSSSSAVLSEVLVLPDIYSNPTKSKRKPALNSKSVVLNDTDGRTEAKRT